MTPRQPLVWQRIQVGLTVVLHHSRSGSTSLIGTTDRGYVVPAEAGALPARSRSEVASHLVAHNEPIEQARTRWIIHGERLIDENRHIRLSVANVELPTGVRFEQYVFRMPRCAMTVVLDDTGDRVLLIWRHRWIIDRWVWELPGGYVLDKDGPTAAAEEVLEETGWRPRSRPQLVLTYQPASGNADYPQDIYFARGAEKVGEPEQDEAEKVAWIPLSDALGMIHRGEIVGGAAIIGIQHALLSAGSCQAAPKHTP